MPAADLSRPRGLALILGGRRLLFALGLAALLGLIISPAYTVPKAVVIGREVLVGLVALLAFGLFEQWPEQLPRWLARWVLQVLGVAIAIALTVPAIYFIQYHGEAMPFWKDAKRLNGFGIMISSGLLLAPWITVAVLFRQRDDAARSQALAFELERSLLERNALDSRLRLLQAQVEPHFLFNTLANVRELVDSGSPQATSVLDSLIAYLRAAVPRLHDPATTLGQELQLVRAYLELMHMRMPDRLQYLLQADESSAGLRCPPMTLLTLVENAVRHGIDPSEEGGRIEVRVREQGGRCLAQVIDTGIGLGRGGVADPGLGTGLATLRERLQLVFGGDAQLRVTALQPHGVCVDLDFPAQRSAA